MRKIVQIFQDSECLPCALADDGTTWWWLQKARTWEPLFSALPQTDPTAMTPDDRLARIAVLADDGRWEQNREEVRELAIGSAPESEKRGWSDAAVNAAVNAYHSYPGNTRSSIRAALEAAAAVREVGE